MISSDPPKRILLLRPDTYGDLVLFEPVLRLLRHAWPGTEVGALIRERYADAVPLLASEGVRFLTTRCDSYREAPGADPSALTALGRDGEGLCAGLRGGRLHRTNLAGGCRGRVFAGDPAGEHGSGIGRSPHPHRAGSRAARKLGGGLPGAGRRRARRQRMGEEPGVGRGVARERGTALVAGRPRACRRPGSRGTHPGGGGFARRGIRRVRGGRHGQRADQKLVRRILRRHPGVAGTRARRARPAGRACVGAGAFGKGARGRAPGWCEPPLCGRDRTAKCRFWRVCWSRRVFTLATTRGRRTWRRRWGSWWPRCSAADTGRGSSRWRAGR